MEFQINSKILNSHIKVAHSAVAKNPVLPILECFLFNLKGDNLTITATNLELTIVSKILVNGQVDGVYAIEADTITKILSTLGDEEITVSVKGNSCVIKTQKGVFESPTDMPDDFPGTPQKEDVESFEMSSETLNNCLSKTLFAVSSDTLRLAMTGVFFNVNKDMLSIVATDAHKLVEHKIIGSFGLDTDISALVPQNALQSLSKTINTGNVNVSINKSNIFFETDNVIIIGRLIDAKFPSYKAVLPGDATIRCEVNKKEVLIALKRCLIYTNKSSNQVNFDFSDNMLNVSSMDLDTSRAAKECIFASIQGTDAIKTGYNGIYLQQILSVISSDHNVTFEMTDPTRATIIKETSKNEESLYLIMPVLVKN